MLPLARELFVCILVSWSIFLMLSLAPGMLITRWAKLPVCFTPLICMVVFGAFGWLTFWAYFVDYRFGRLFCRALVLFAIGFLVYAARHHRSVLKSFVRSPDIYIPMLMQLFLLLALNGFTYLAFPGPGISYENYPAMRFLPKFVPDNILPHTFALKLYNGEKLSPLFLDWLSSDRPPLQAGIALMQWPLARHFRVTSLAYQSVSCLLQASWIFAVWAICRVGAMNPKRMLFVFLCALVNGGFFFFHTLYVWPKMIGGTYVCLVATLLLLLPISWKNYALAGVSAGLAMLSHGGAFFSLLGIAICAIPRFVLTIKSQYKAYAMALLTATITFLPWIGYQKYFDPPGDRLMKWHLAGVQDRDDRTFFEALQDSYGALSRDEIITRKWGNINFLRAGWSDWFINFNQAGINDQRQDQFYLHGRTMGLLNYGVILLPLILLWRRREPTTKMWFYVGIISFVSFIEWAVLMFIPNHNVIHQGSYGTTILGFLAATWALSFLPAWIRYFIFTAQAIQFFFVWLAYALGDVPSENLQLVWGIVAGCVGIGWCLNQLVSVPLPLPVFERDYRES